MDSTADYEIMNRTSALLLEKVVSIAGRHLRQHFELHIGLIVQISAELSCPELSWRKPGGQQAPPHSMQPRLGARCSRTGRVFLLQSITLWRR